MNESNDRANISKDLAARGVAVKPVSGTQPNEDDDELYDQRFELSPFP